MIATLEQQNLLTKAEMTLEEGVNMDKLRIIRDNFAVLYSANKLGGFGNMKGSAKEAVDEKTFRTIINGYYTTKLKGNTVNYKYANGKKAGRMFSCGCSLQTLPKKIRGCISRGIYIDIDMTNAHIVILKHFCDKEGIATPNLDRYINDREPLLAELMLVLGIERDLAKTIPLSVINGGGGSVTVDNERLYHEADWLTGLKNEMLKAFTCFKSSTKGRKIYDRVKKTKERNLEGSTMNVMFCEEENKLLVCLYRYLQSIEVKVGSFIFDGLMIRADSLNGANIADLLLDMEVEMTNKLGYNMKLCAKEFDDINLTGLVKMDDCDMSERGLADVILSSVDYKYHKTKKCFYMFNKESKLWVEYNEFSIFWDFIKDILPTYISEHHPPESDECKEGLSMIKSATKCGNIVKFIQNTIKAKNDDDFINKNFNLTKGILPVADGMTVDLKTGITRERVKEDYWTRTTERNILDEPDEKFVRDYIKSILSTDDEKYVDCMIDTVGYMMTGENNLKQFYVLIGAKDTGKSLFVALLLQVFGFLGGMANDKVFKVKTQSCHDTEAFSLEGKRIASVSELGENEKFNEELIKKISGGDFQNLRRAGSRDNEEVKFDCVLILATNEVPTFHEQAFAGRMRVFKFDNVFENNPVRRDEILANVDSFFTVFTRSAKRFYDDGMNIADCEQVVVASKQLVTAKNPVSQYWSEQDEFEFVDDINRRVKKVEIWNSFLGAMGRNTLGRNKFYAMFIDIYKKELLRTDYDRNKEWSGIQRISCNREEEDMVDGRPEM